MIKFSPPEHIKDLLNRLDRDGHAAFLVGGCVRDSVLRRPVHDWDVATSAAPVDVARLFKKTVLTGEKFGTVTVVLPGNTVEVTTFRAEGEYIDGRRPERVEFVTRLDDDLSRRDFTMNAMAVSIAGELIDPFDGMGDIKKRVIRCVGGPNTRFKEDSLRMFRAFRFRAQLGFAIDPETMSAVCANADRARLISAERIRDELEKTLMTQKPGIAGEMVKVGLLEKYIIASGKCPVGIKEIARLPQEPALRWCAFCAVLLDNHLLNSSSKFLHDLRLDRKTIKACSTAVSIPDFPGDHVGVKRLLAEYGQDAVRCAAAAYDTLRGGAVLARTDGVINSGECYSLGGLAVSGSDLIECGHPPGHKIGETLKNLLYHVLEYPDDNEREALLKLAARSDG